MRLFEFAPGLAAHASGGLWLPEQEILLVADVHLGYAWAQRRRGQLGPLLEGDVEYKMSRTLEELKPQKLIVLGDLVHAPRPSPGEREAIERTLASWSEQTCVILVRGNHDRGFERDFGSLGIPVLDSWQNEKVIAIHGDHAAPGARSAQHLVLGHWHPKVAITDSAGATQRLQSFLLWPGTTILPAFSPFAAGFDVSRGLPPELSRFVEPTDPEVLAATGTRVAPLGKFPSKFRGQSTKPRNSRSPAQSS